MSSLKRRSFCNCFRVLACLLVAAAWAAPSRSDPGDTELKDETGKTIIQYIPEVPSGLAPAGTMDPTKQVGLILVFPEHEHPTGVRLVAGRREDARGVSKVALVAASDRPLSYDGGVPEPLTTRRS